MLAVGNVGVQAHVGHADLNVASVFDFAIGVEGLIDPWLFGILDVYYDQPLFASRYISIGSHDVKVMGVRDGRSGTIDRASFVGIGDVDDLQTLGIGNERVPELHLHGARSLYEGCSDFARDSGFSRVTYVDDNQPPVAGYVRVGTGDDDVISAVEHAVRVPGQSPFQEVVPWIPIKQRCDVYQDESFVFVGDIQERIDQVDALFVVPVLPLFVLRIVFTRWVHCHGGGRRNRHRVLRLNVEPLSERRDRGS